MSVWQNWIHNNSDPKWLEGHETFLMLYLSISYCGFRFEATAECSSRETVKGLIDNHLQVRNLIIRQGLELLLPAFFCQRSTVIITKMSHLCEF